MVDTSKKTVIRLLIQVIKTRIRYIFSLNKKIFWMSEPAHNFGLTDHPLDHHGEPIVDVFSAITKLTSKKANSILELSFKEKKTNSFLFDGTSFNIYRIRELGAQGGDLYRYEGEKSRNCLIQIDFIQPSIYRLRCSEQSLIPDHDTEMVCNNIHKDVKVDFSEEEEFFKLETSEMTLELFKTDFRIRVREKSGKIITESGGKTKNEFPNAMDAWPLGFIYDKKSGRNFGVDSFTLYPQEAVYGLGEKFSPLNKIGQTIGIWNCEGSGNTTLRSYKNIPFFMSTRGYGVFVNESKPITFWIGSRETCKNIFAVENDLIDYFFFKGNFKQILYNYTELTGKSPVPPKWSFGTWMSRISYSSQDEVLNVANKLREMEFPSDVINIDTNWFKDEWFCDWEFSEEKFPDPEGMFAELAKKNFRVCLWQSPYIVDSLKLRKEAEKKKLLAKNKGPFYFMTWPAHIIDFSKQEAVEWYQKKLKNLFTKGAAVIKVDFGEGIERHQQFDKYSGTEMHNLFPLLYNKAAFDITKETFGKGIIWARSAYAGSQKYPVHWSGDNSSNFENLLSSLRGGLSLGMCGFTFWGQDCGGFMGTPSDKQYIRWTQFSIFNSHIRYHGGPPRFREPWNYSETTQKIVRDFLVLRYRLLPYIYSEAYFMAKQGRPMVSPLALEFQDDPSVHNIEDQFLFGRNILVAPIFTEEDSRTLYIPEGLWYDYWTKSAIEGPKWINRSYDQTQIPLFIKGGTIIPLGPNLQYIDENREDDELSLEIFPDESGKAVYLIKDDNQEIEIESTISNNTLFVNVNPPIRKINVNYPDGISISEVVINNTSP